MEQDGTLRHQMQTIFPVDDAGEIGLDGSRRTYAYDACGRGVAVQDGPRQTRYERDVLGRLTAKQAAKERCEYLYDKAGRIESAELYLLYGGESSLHNRVTLKHGPRGEVLEEYTPTGFGAAVTDLERDDLHRRCCAPRAS